MSLGPQEGYFGALGSFLQNVGNMAEIPSQRLPTLLGSPRISWKPSLVQRGLRCFERCLKKEQEA